MTATTKLEAVGTSVVGLKDGFLTCNKNMEAKLERLRKDRVGAVATKMKFDLAKKKFEVSVKEVITPQTAATVTSQVKTVADEEKVIAEDCTDILHGSPNATDGFYDVKPFCGNNSIRVYCDMRTHQGLHVYHGLPPGKPGLTLTRDLGRPEATQRRCDSVGSEGVYINRCIVSVMHLVDGSRAICHNHT